MKTESINIRPYELTDIPLLHEAVIESREQLAQWMPWCHPSYNEQDSRSWIETQLLAFSAGTGYAFVICDERGHFLGGCGLSHLDTVNRRANLGYWVRASSQRKGVALEATKQLVSWAFQHTELHRLEIVSSVSNIPSQRVAEQAGGQKEGVLRSRLLLNGKFHDAVLYAIVRGKNSPMAA